MLMNAELYDALKHAQGVSDEQARAAATSVASFEERFHELRSALKSDQIELGQLFDNRFHHIERDIAVLKMSGTSVAGIVFLIVPSLL